MCPEHPPQPNPQEIRVISLVPEQALPAMQHSTEAQGGEVDMV